MGASSTPSATIRIPRLRPRSTVERTITASLPLFCMSITNDLTILISLTGSCLRYESDECPMPKSSTDRETPWLLMESRICLVRTGSAMIELSVISSVSWEAGTRHFASCEATCSGRRLSIRFRTERFTETLTWSPASIQARCWRRAMSRTLAVRDLISPVCSARPMNSSGPTMPRSGCCHRTRASTPTTRPVSSPIFGW